jgi:transcriptional regulator with XRE-family HTH domain
MKEREKTFGKIILEARRKKGLNLRECAALILKEDSTPISFQYLNDLENNRRKPPSEHIIEQISAVLDIPVEFLYFYAEIFPKGLNKNADQEKIVAAYKNFVKSLSQKVPA